MKNLSNILIIILTIGVMSLMIIYSPKQLTEDETSLVRIEQLAKQYNGVLVEVAADWCPYCKQNQQYLTSLETINYLQKNNIYFVSYNTTVDPEGKQILSANNHRTIPIYFYVDDETGTWTKLDINLRNKSIKSQLEKLVQ